MRSSDALQRAVNLSHGYAYGYFLRGTEERQASAASDAEAFLRKAIALDARFIAPHYPLALLLYAQQRYAEEKELLLEAQKLDATDWRWPFEIARFHPQQGHWESALRHRITAHARPQPPPKTPLILPDI